MSSQNVMSKAFDGKPESFPPEPWCLDDDVEWARNNVMCPKSTSLIKTDEEIPSFCPFVLEHKISEK